MTRRSTPTSAPAGCSRPSAARETSSTCAASPAAAADDDRDAGFQRALEEYPDINVIFESHTNWDQATGVQQFNDFLATGDNFDGIWTSGIDNVIVDAMIEADVELVPIVGADNAGFVQQLLEVEGLVGAAVTNSAAVGGAGVTLALQILNGEEPARADHADRARRSGPTTPRRASPRSRRPTTRTSIRCGRSSTRLEGWTDYSKEEIVACEGP